jgi:hypothetical protein
MKAKIEEKIIEEGLQNFLYKKSWFNVISQVSFTRKKIDLVVKSDIHNEIWAIEVKVKDWKTALRQANLNSIACNLSFVAIWHEYANAALKNKSRFEELGIGLMVVDKDYMPTIKVYPIENMVNINAFESIKHLI